MSHHSQSELIEICKIKLIETKAELLNRIKDAKQQYFEHDRGTDEGDQTMAILAEKEFLSTQDRLRKQLLEIEMALARIETGKYGICEETDEPIEEKRLLAMPWTRLSIEGAEIQEAMEKRFVNN